MPGIEVLVFIVAALLAGGLSMGGITLVYFRDKWRADPHQGSTPPQRARREASVFDEAA